MTERSHPFEGPEMFDDEVQLEAYEGPRPPKSALISSVIRGINIRNMLKRMERSETP